MPYAIASDGARLFYEVHGSGPTDVLLLHGMGSSEIWTPLLPQLDLSALRLISCDFRGHGRSGGDARGFDYTQLNEDVLAVADAAGCSRCVIVAFSGGCKNAAWFAMQSPERVRGLVLVAPPGLGIVPVPPEVITLLVDSLERTGDVPADFDPWFTEKIGSHRSRVVRPLAATPRAVLEASVRLWLGTSIVPDVASLSLPALVVAGAREPLYHPEFQRQTTLATLPHATMEVLDCSHFIPCEEPAALAALITRFVGKPPTSPPWGSWRRASISGPDAEK